MPTKQKAKVHFYISGPSTNAVLAFGGIAAKFGGIPRYELKNTLVRVAPNWNKHFIIDHHASWYHEGLRGISKDIDTTANYLQGQIKNYDRIVMMGVSAGGYAAILFGSLLNADMVIAFTPQTIISKRRGKYHDLKPYINDRTEYILYGDSSAKDIFHSISHCYNIKQDNVKIHAIDGIDLRKMRDNGELDEIITTNLMSLE